MGFLDKLFKKNGHKEPEAPVHSLSFEEALQSSGLVHLRSSLVHHLKNAVFAITIPDEAQVPIGASRMGGLPDLPRGISWPEAQGKPLGFVGQLNLNEIKPFDKDDLLPDAGLLYFFYDSQQSVWGFDPADKDHWAVIFHPVPVEDLQRSALPFGLPADAIFRECRLQFSEQVSLPDECPNDVKDCGEDYFKLLEYLGAFSTHHQVLGHESPVQGDVKLECQLVSNGLYCGDPSGYNAPQAEGLRAGTGDWMLLLQVDSDDNANMMWGDLGRLYFCIRKQDLSQRRFDRVWMIFQCH